MVVLLFPVIMLVLAMVLAVATLESAKTRVTDQVDQAAVTSAYQVDMSTIWSGAQLSAETEQVAREYLQRNLTAVSSLIEEDPADIASSADVYVSNTAGPNPITGLVDPGPSVTIRARVSVLVPLLGLIGIHSVPITVIGWSELRH
jgi:Flp pilus assembly protein TadG